MNWIVAVLCLLMINGCAWFKPAAPPPDPPMRLVVGPVSLDAPVTSPSDLYTFEQDPTPDMAPQIFTQLIDEVELAGQRHLTEQLTRQPGFLVVPFAEARRLQTNQNPTRHPRGRDNLTALERDADADIVITGRIVDYGIVRWQYWIPGLLLSMMAETLIVGAATEFNPVAMIAVAASELVTDVPFWWGGAYLLGWALRPVSVQVEAVQVRGCPGNLWEEEVVVMLVPGETLKQLPADQRRRKDVQLAVNLSRAMTEIADRAGRELRLSPCPKPDAVAKNE